MHPPPVLVAQGLTGGDHLPVDLRPFWVVRDAVGDRPDEQQMGAGIIDVLREALEHADRVLEPVPAGDLGQDPGVLGERLILDDQRPPVNAGHASVEPAEDRRVAAVGGEADPVENRGHRLRGQLLVLRGEGIDRRVNHCHLGRVETLPGVVGAGENILVGRLDQRPQQ
jgi:hypothetical protein